MIFMTVNLIVFEKYKRCLNFAFSYRLVTYNFIGVSKKRNQKPVSLREKITVITVSKPFSHKNCLSFCFVFCICCFFVVV